MCLETSPKEAQWPHKPLLTTLFFHWTRHTPDLSAFRNAIVCFRRFLLCLPWILLFLQTGNRDWNSPNRTFQFCLNWWVRWSGLKWIINEKRKKNWPSFHIPPLQSTCPCRNAPALWKTQQQYLTQWPQAKWIPQMVLNMYFHFL